MFKVVISFGLFVALFSLILLAHSLHSSDVKKDQANHQINEIVKFTEYLFAFQPDFGNGNLLPILSGGSSGEFSGMRFAPVMANKRERDRYMDSPVFQAMKDLQFSDNGERLESGLVGNIMVVGNGDSFTVSFPYCPQDVCSKTSITIAK